MLIREPMSIHDNSFRRGCSPSTSARYRLFRQSLVKRLSVSRRTLFRDLNALQDAGIPYYHEPGKGYRFARGFFLPPVNLTVPEMLGILLLTKGIASRKGWPFLQEALTAVQKLTSTIPDPIKSVCTELTHHITVDSGAQPADDHELRHYTDLQRCIDEGRVCNIVYKSPVEDQPITCELEPYALHFSTRSWYVFGRTDVHREVRLFKLTRIASFATTDRFFERPKAFSPLDKLGDAWQLIPEGIRHHVELEFTPKVATNVSEVRWHHTQQHRILRDGRCVMTFQVDGINEIAWWICGYADQVVVRKPAVLRNHVRDMLRNAAKQY